MEYFPDGAPVRLRSRACDLLLYAEEDGVGVSLSSLRSSPRTSWMVSHVERDGAAYILLRSAPDGRYLSVSADAAPPGALGLRAVQSEAVGAVWSVRSAGDGGRDVLVSHSMHGLLCPQGSAAGVRHRVKARSLQPRWSVETAPVAPPPRLISTSPDKEEVDSSTPPIALADRAASAALSRPNTVKEPLGETLAARAASGGRENTAEEPPAKSREVAPPAPISQGRGLSASAAPFRPRHRENAVCIPAPYGWTPQPERDMALPMIPWEWRFPNAYSSAAPPWVPAPVPAPPVHTEQPNSTYSLGSSSQHECLQIHDVWADGAGTAFAAVEKLLNRGSGILIAIDSEFAVPDAVPDPDGAAKSEEDHKGEPSSPDLHYKQLLGMVNGGDLIQVGLALASTDLKILAVYQFNLKFSADWRMPGHPGVVFLQDDAGFDMTKHATQGIAAQEFADWFSSSGLIRNQSVTWVSFNGYTDFGFIIRDLTGESLPPDRQQFLDRFWELFPQSQDLRVFSKLGRCRPEIIHGGLSVVSNKLGVVKTVGKAHNSGYDALITVQCLEKMAAADPHFMLRINRYCGALYGICDISLFDRS